MSLKADFHHPPHAVHRRPLIDFASIPWYVDSENYEHFRANAMDASAFFPTFRQWLIVALEHERQTELRGFPIIRIRMDMTAFEEWCQKGGGQNDAAGRSAFAEERARRMF